jgi:hypothetical protein
MMTSWPINLTLGLVRVVAMSGRSLAGNTMPEADRHQRMKPRGSAAVISSDLQDVQAQ